MIAGLYIKLLYNLHVGILDGTSQYSVAWSTWVQCVCEKSQENAKIVGLQLIQVLVLMFMVATLLHIVVCHIRHT